MRELRHRFEMYQTVSVEEAFRISGGFGLFQALASGMMIMAMGSVAFFLYAFSFLEHRPSYECRVGDTWAPCGPSDFCPPSEDGTHASGGYVKDWRVNY